MVDRLVLGRKKAIWFAVTLTNALTTLKNAFTELTAFADALKPSHPTAKWVTGVELLLQDIISLNYLKSLKSASMTSCLWSKFAEFKLWGWRCTLWWWKRRLQSWYAFLHKGLHAWQVQCLTNTFFNVCWWHRLDRVVYNARRRDGTILGALLHQSPIFGFRRRSPPIQHIWPFPWQGKSIIHASRYLNCIKRVSSQNLVVI